MTYEEKLPYYIESICRALNIKNENELNQLLSIFDKRNLVHPKHVKKTDDSGDSNEDEINKDEEENEKSFEIDPDCVIEILEEFYNEKKINSKDQSKNICKTSERHYIIKYNLIWR